MSSTSTTTGISLFQSTTSTASSCCSIASSLSSSCDSDSSFEPTEFEHMSTFDLLSSMSNMHDDIVYLRNGYQKMHKICDTLQGALYKALVIKGCNERKTYVTIKRTNKALFQKGIAVQDGFTFCVADNCVQEASILKHLTVDHKSFGNHVVQYIDYFESASNHFLVTEYSPSSMNLKEFLASAKQYMKNGQLSMKQYQVIAKQLIWQLFVTMQSLHISMKCCILNLCSENISVENADFIETEDGVIIDPNVSIKLHNFGVAKLFRNDDFVCLDASYLQKDAYSAPNVFNDEIYDAQCADNWKLGMILFSILTVGENIYKPLEINILNSGHWALMNGKLKQCLIESNIFHYFDTDSFDLLQKLLAINETQRLKGKNILTHKWFGIYYKKIPQEIAKKFYFNVQEP